MRIKAPWMRHAAVIIGYILAYELQRRVWIEHWQLQVGLNLSLVLTLPRKYWPALLVGGFLAAGPVAYDCLKIVGPISSGLILFPVMIFAMLPVWVLKKQLSSLVFDSRVLQPITPGLILNLLACIVVTGGLTGLFDTALVVVQRLQGFGAHDPSFSPEIWIWRYLLGACLGGLTVTPVILAIYEAIRNTDSWATLIKRASRSRLLVEGVVLGVGALVLLTVMGHETAEEAWRQVVRMIMFVPVALMAVKYGWQGAAVGGTAASVGLVLAMPSELDADTMLAQAFMAGAIAVLLPLGAHISRLNEQDRQSSDELHRALQVARRELYQSELRLRDGVQAMGHVYDSLLDAYSRLLQRIRHTMSEDEERRYRKQLVLAKHERHWLANSIHPTQWQSRGLTATLWDGPIAQMLNDSSITYYARIPEIANELTPGAQLTLYRMACEAVAYLLDREPATRRIQLRLVVSRAVNDEQLWAALIVEGRERARDGSDSPLPMSATIISEPSRSSMVSKDYRLSKLGAMGLSLSDMRDRVSFYEGKVRAHRGRNRVAFSLRDVRESAVA